MDEVALIMKRKKGNVGLETVPMSAIALANGMACLILNKTHVSAI